MIETGPPVYGPSRMPVGALVLLGPLACRGCKRLIYWGYAPRQVKDRRWRDEASHERHYCERSLRKTREG